MGLDRSLGWIAAGRYRDASFLDQELRCVFPAAWTVATRLERIPNKGDFVTLSEIGQNLVIVRGKDGAVRVFHNTCRHRGTQLVTGSGTIKAFRCPYHDWKYSLDGRLRDVPDAAGFDPPIDKSTRGLLEVRSAVWGGFVWINLDGKAPPLRDFLGAVADELDIYSLEQMRPIEERVWTLDANWKAVLDNACESYHLKAVHGMSVDKHVFDEPAFHRYGDHFRAVLAIAPYKWRKALDDACTPKDAGYTSFQKSVLHKYVIFPNTLVNVLPYHLTVFQVWPVETGVCRFRYGFYERRTGPILGLLRARATHLASRWIWREDLRIIRTFQAGVAVPHQDDLPLHREEAFIGHFHDTLTRYIEGSEHRGRWQSNRVGSRAPGGAPR